jgi:tetratricopeptide (TPR) repeat protein
LKALGRAAEGQVDIDAARRVYAKIDDTAGDFGMQPDKSPPLRMATTEPRPGAAPTGEACKQGVSMPYEERLKACSSAVSRAWGKARVDALLQRALLYTNANDWEHARADCEEAINLNPRRSLAYSGLAEALAGKGDIRGGVEAYSRAIALEPTNANYLARRCFMQSRLGRNLNAALEDCQHALQLQPGADFLLGARGFAYLARKEYAFAIADYDAVLRLTSPGVPPDPYSLFGRGLAKLRSGNAAAGRADLSTAASIYPEIASEYAAWGFKP